MNIDGNPWAHARHEEERRQERLRYERAQYEAWERAKMEIEFDELDPPDSFYARARRKRIEDPKPKSIRVPIEEMKLAPELEAGIASTKEVRTLQKQIEKQVELLKEFQPSIKRIETVFQDALMRMEADGFDDVYQIKEMQTEFKKLNSLITKHIPKEEIKFDPQDIRNPGYVKSTW